ncbi:hypothetical protein M9Y10_037754 [Tritrichomonas musculus]|uniref:Uncharacterized protein n=1 Tax=Tritrichomonas musculus TaxID=1915356 RepID=A0ABR2GRD2_9EUKA
MDDPIIQSFLLADDTENKGKEGNDTQKTPLFTESNLDEKTSVKLLEAAVLSTDDILSEHAFNIFRRAGFNYMPIKYVSNEDDQSKPILKTSSNGNVAQKNCLLTYIICNRHMNKILEKLQSMNKQNQHDAHIQIRVGRFLEILRLCALSHPKSTFANVWFLPWILEFINFDVTYVFFSKIFNYGESYQKWMNSNDFFISALNAARELQAKLSNNKTTKEDFDVETSNFIDNQKLDNLYLLISDFLTLQNFRDKCQSPFRLAKMIKLPFHHTTLANDINEDKEMISQFKMTTIISFTKMLKNLYSKGSKKAFEDNLAEYVMCVNSLMEIENKKSGIFPRPTFEEDFEKVKISHIKVNLIELISLVIDGISEKDEKIFSPSSASTTTTSSVSPPPSFSSSSSSVSFSSQLFSFSSSASETADSPPLLNLVLCIAEESLLRPRNEFEFQKAVKIITALIRKKLINDDEVSDVFFSGLMVNYKREKRPIQRMALYVLASELPSLKDSIKSDNINNKNDINVCVGETDEINEIVKIDEIEKIDGIEKVSESDKISEIDEIALIDSIVNDISDSDCGDFISPMQDVMENDYGND